MKRFIKLSILGFIFSFTFSGCFLKSVHPLISHSDSQRVEGLKGVWQDEDDATWYFINDITRFRQYMGMDENPFADDQTIDMQNAYFVFYETKFNGRIDTTLFIGSTIELNDHYYLDLKVMEIGNGLPELVNSHLFAAHTFSKIAIRENELTIELFNDEWIRDQLLNNRVRLKYERVDGEEPEVLVTATTKELQEFVKKYGQNEKAYSDPLSLTRIK
ncbi:MAG: hypothetical protein U5K69_22795 [Balneolaceae bacterium]|nr:hypothetical protein [Balneolaceae bacterium]